MNFRVVIQPDAEAEVEEAFNYIAARSRDYAVPWLRGLYKAVATLEKFPPRCGVAPEGKYFKEEIRQYLRSQPAPVPDPVHHSSR